MTTFEPGARVVFTHGLRSRPASTAFFASSAAPTITDGLDVLVHEVIAAITTEPWSIDIDVPSSSVTGTGFDGLLLTACAGVSAGPLPPPFSRSGTNGSDAGNVSAISSSSLSSLTKLPSESRNDVFASVSDTRSCGRFGPARDGTTVLRSSSSSSEYLA